LRSHHDISLQFINCAKRDRVVEKGIDEDEGLTNHKGWSLQIINCAKRDRVVAKGIDEDEGLMNRDKG
jgi:hypothetical protein